MGDDDGEDAAVGGGAQVLHHLDLKARVEGCGRLVGEDHRRLHRQHARQCDAAALSAGEFGGGTGAELRHVGRLHGAFDGGFVGR